MYLDNFPYIERFDPHGYEYHARCSRCKAPVKVFVPAQGLFFYRQGVMGIQNAFPEMSASDKEIIISGTCDECWMEMFPPED